MRKNSKVRVLSAHRPIVPGSRVRVINKESGGDYRNGDVGSVLAVQGHNTYEYCVHYKENRNYRDECGDCVRCWESGSVYAYVVFDHYAYHRSRDFLDYHVVPSCYLVPIQESVR